MTGLKHAIILRSLNHLVGVTMSKPQSDMPDEIMRGSGMNFSMGHLVDRHRRIVGNTEPDYFDFGGHHKAGEEECVLGYWVPPFQRDSVWSRSQRVRFIESAWLGISLGSYCINEVGVSDPTDGWLIDGQQRLRAVKAYLDNEFKVFGKRWNQLNEFDVRRFIMGINFPCIEIHSKDKEYLRTLYMRLNFGGTAHTKKDRKKAEKTLTP